MRDYPILISDTYPPKEWFCCPKGGSLRALGRSLSVTSNQTMCSTGTVAAVVARCTLYVWRARLYQRRVIVTEGVYVVDHPREGEGYVLLGRMEGGVPGYLSYSAREGEVICLFESLLEAKQFYLHWRARIPGEGWGGAPRDWGTDEGAAKLRPRLR